jgi:hypothetical protein
MKSNGFNKQLHSFHQLTIPLLAYNRFPFRLYEPANQYFFDRHKYNQVRRVRGAGPYPCKCSGGSRALVHVSIENYALVYMDTCILSPPTHKDDYLCSPLLILNS